MAEEQKDELKEQLAKSLAFLKVGTKNFLHLKGIARDLNVASQNIQRLLKAVGGEPRKSGQTDMHILSPSQIDKKLEVDVTKASLITGEEKSPSVVGTALKAAAISKLKKSAIGKKVVSFSSKLGLAKIIPKIIGLFTKIAFAKVYAVLLGLSIINLIVNIFWESIVSAWDSFTESVSDIFQSIKDGAGQFIDSIKNLFSKETLDNILTKVSDFFKPVTDVFKNIYDKVYKFVLEKVNDVKKFFGIPIEIKKGTPQPIGEGVEEQAKKKTKEEEEAKKAKEKPAEKPAPAKPTEKPAEKPTEKPAPAKPASAPGGRVPTPAPAAAPPTPSAEKQPPAVPTEGIVGVVVKGLEEQGIKNNFTKIAILANIRKEVGKDMQPKNENLAAYKNTSNDRIREVFTTRAKKYSDEELNKIKQDPVTFGEMVYGKDTKIGQGMGNKEEGDGYKYRGRGFIQFTGKNNYDSLGKAIGENLVNNPDKVNDPVIAAKMTGAYIIRGLRNKVNEFTSQSEANRAVTQAVGGAGLNLDTGIGAKILAKVEAESTSFSGSDLGGSSSQVASGQRQQAKPSAPVMINASTTNNTKVEKNETVAINKPQNTAGMLAARAT